MLRNLSAAERPRERCLRAGPRTLSLRECLALLLNTGPAELGCMGLATRILERPGSGLSDAEQDRAFFLALEVSGGAHLSGIKGLGPAGRARILAAFELGRRYAIYRETSQKRLSSARRQDLSFLAREALTRVDSQLRNESQEWLGFVPCFRNGEIGQLCVVERGVRTHVNTEPMELFARILALRPHAFALVHNHPSGDLSPSAPDLEITQRVADVGRQLGVRLLGHWIVASRGEIWLNAS